MRVVCRMLVKGVNFNKNGKEKYSKTPKVKKLLDKGINMW